MMARVLREAGYDLGTTWTDKVGGYENPVICQFYACYLGDPTFPFEGFPYTRGTTPGENSFFLYQLIPPVKRFQQLDLQVAKFSYLLMNPAFVSIWHKFRPPQLGDRFLVMNRNKAAVIQSKLQHLMQFEHDSMLLSQTCEELTQNFIASQALLRNYEYEFRLCPFPQCVTEPGLAIRALEELGISKPLREAWDKVVDPTKVHFK